MEWIWDHLVATTNSFLIPCCKRIFPWNYFGCVLRGAVDNWCHLDLSTSGQAYSQPYYHKWRLLNVWTSDYIKYLRPSVYVTRSWNQIFRVSDVIRVAELTCVSIELLRSQVIWETLVLAVTPNLALVAVVYCHRHNQVTNQDFASRWGQVVHFPAYIWKYNPLHLSRIG